MKEAHARLERVLATVPAALKLISEEEGSRRPVAAGWSKKEILGHLIDSACNNHQRFVRAQFAPAVELPGYAQEDWVHTQQYGARPWADLIGLWTALNQHLLAVIAAIPAAALENTCAIGGRPPVTLAFLIADYMDHLENHLRQILGEDLQAKAAELLELYRGEWWTNRRELADVERMLGHTDEVVAIRNEAGGLIAFARVLTDSVYKALILDVIVKPAARGQGLGRKLIDAIMDHPSLAGIRHFELYCRPPLVAFYEKWGFTKDLGEISFMRRTR